MSYNAYPHPFDLGELSRRKLRKVAESSDTLRRAVLIHNIVRSTASLPPSPTLAYDDSNCNYNCYPTPADAHRQNIDAPTVEEAAEEHCDAAAEAEGSNLFVFPCMASSSSQEQDWLDSILDDLEGDVHVSVVPVDDTVALDSDMDDDASDYPLFPASHCGPAPAPPSSSLHSSPPVRPTSPAPVAPSVYYAPPESPPTSPPGLDNDTIDSDSDSDEDFGEVTSASAQFNASNRYFFNHLPFHDHSLPKRPTFFPYVKPSSSH